MLTFPEIHGLIVHLPILAVPVVAVLGFLRWRERGGEAVERAEPWAFAAAVLGAALAVVSGLIVLGGARTTLRQSNLDLAWVHLILGVLLVLLFAAVGFWRWRNHRAGRPYVARAVAMTGLAGIALVFVIGYIGGRMVYIHGVGVHAGGALAQSAAGGEALAAGLATGGNEVALGRRAFQTGFGCAGCHGMQAQGDRGPCLSGGFAVDRFRNTHGSGLFPPAIVGPKLVAALEAWLRTNPTPQSACSHGD